MKCPLRILVLRTDATLGPLFSNDCLKEECAWWDQAYEECCIFSMVRLFDGILMDLNQIRDKMPHEE